MAAEEAVVAQTPAPTPPAEAPKESEAVVAEEKAVEVVAPATEAAAETTTTEEKKEGTAEEEKPVKPAKVVKPKPTKEEIEKKALEEFKLKVEEAIKANEFALPPPPPPPKEEAKPEEVKKEEPVTEEKKDEAPAPEAPKAEAEAVAESKPEEKKEEPAPAAPAAPATEAPKEEVPVTEAPKEEAPATEAPKEEAVVEEKTEEPPAPPEDVFLWGIPLLHTANDERTDVILTKFLRARDFKVNQALAMLKDTVRWRKTYKADEILEEDLGNDFDGLAYMFGEDKSGHPVCYNVFGGLQDKELQNKVWGTDASKFLRWRVQLLEKGIKLLDFKPGSPNALLQVIDFKNAPWPAKKAFLLGNAISLLQDNYPELVTKTVFINVPWIYSAILAIVSPILTQHQKNKFVISRLGKSTEALFKYISPEKVPIQYGGLGRPNDEEFSGAEAPVTEETIKPGEKKTVEVAVTTSGATVTWDVVVVGHDVSYGAEFQPDQEGGYTTIIEKTRKIAAQLEEPIRNSFKTSEAGKVVLSIDNSLSRKKKVVVYRYIVKGSTTPPSAAPVVAETEVAAV